MGSGRPYKATAADRKQVGQMCAAGISHEQIALVLGINADTLKKHYDVELKTASPIANNRVAGALYAKALSGNVTAMIFWLKTRARWSESAPEGGETAQPTKITLEFMPKPDK